MKATLRIVCMVTQMEAGGAQTALLRLAAGLRQRGHFVETWFLYQKRPTFVGIEGVRVILGQPPRHPGHAMQLMWRLHRQLRSFRPDAVITFTHYANVLGQLAARLAGVRIRIASQRNPASSFPRPARIADRWLGSWGLYGSNVMVSNSVRDSFAGYSASYRRRISVVPNGIDFRPSSLSPAAARAKFQLPVDAPLLVTVGRMARQKNQAVLLKALATLPGVHLAIAGGGELKEQLAALAVELHIQDRVHFLHEVLQPDIPDLLRCADAFALPSKFEGLSNALLEAMGAGLPIIASDIPAQSDVLRPATGEAVGLLIAPDDLQGWRDAIARVMEDASLRTAMQARSLARVMDYTTVKMVDGFERLLLGSPDATAAMMEAKSS